MASTKNAYARGKRASLAWRKGSDRNRGNPYGGAIDSPERAQHVAWARAYERHMRKREAA